MTALLEANKIEIRTKEDTLLVRDLSFVLNKGEILGIVGESGSGKSISCLSILGLLPKGLHCSNGDLNYFSSDKNWDLLKLTEREKIVLRRKEVSMIFQEPLTALNPVLRCKTQLYECLELAGVQKKHYYQKAKECLKLP